MIQFLLGAAAGAGGLLSAAFLSEYLESEDERMVSRNKPISPQSTESGLKSQLTALSLRLSKLQLETASKMRPDFGIAVPHADDTYFEEVFRDLGFKPMLRFSHSVTIMNLNTLKEQCLNLVLNFCPVIKAANTMAVGNGKPSVAFSDVNFDFLKRRFTANNSADNEGWNDDMIAGFEKFSACLEDLSGRVGLLIEQFDDGQSDLKKTEDANV